MELLLIWVVCAYLNVQKLNQVKNKQLIMVAFIASPLFTFINLLYLLFAAEWTHLK